MSDQLQRRGRQRAVLRVGGVAGEVDRVADLPGQARRGRVDHRVRRGVTDRDGDRRRVGRALVVGDPQAWVIDARRGVGVRGGRAGRVAECAVAVEIPRVAQRPTFRVGGARAVEAHRQRGGTVGRVRRDPGGRRLVGGRVGDAVHGPVVHVDVEQVAAGADLQVDGMPSGAASAVDADERLQPGGVGQPVRACEHRPDLITGVVGEEQRAVVLRDRTRSARTPRP